MRRQSLVQLVLVALAILVLSEFAKAEPRFLTLPFNDAGVKIQQGWIYTFGDQSSCGHQGIDYVKGTIDNSATWQSFDVIAAADGEAVLRTSGSYGDYVTIKTIIEGVTYYTLYAHLDDTQRKLQVGVPTHVTRGKVIGRAGKTGSASNGFLHLHFELSKGGFGQSACNQVNGCGTCRLDPYGIYGQRPSYPSSTSSACSSSSFYWTQCPPSPIGPNPITGATLWHPDGSVLKLSNDATAWLIENGKRRGVPSIGAFEGTRLGWSRIIAVSSAELNCYPADSNLAASHRLVKRNSSTDSTVYLIRDNRYKSAFTSGAVFEGLGYRWEDVSVISDAEFAQYSDHPAAPLLYSPFPDGSLIKKIGDPAVYVITNGKKRLIASGTAFEKAGYNWGLIISELSPQTVDDIQGIQPPIDENAINQCSGGVSTSGGADPNPAFTITASASPNPIAINQSVTFTVNVTNMSQGAADTIVDIEVYNSSGQKVFQEVREHQYFAVNQTQTYNSQPWIPSAAGLYTVKAGVFNSSWTVLYHWNDNALTLNVGNSASYQIDIWWPTDGVQVSGTQPFKALVTNLSLAEYSMYWQVDGGNLVLMYDSYQDYPHKEALVDLSGWTWRGNGPYLVNFVAKNSSGTIISQRSVTIYVIH